MKRLEMMLVVCALATVSHRVWADEPRTNEVLTVILELSDGSRVVGTLGVESVSVQTSYAKMNVPLRQIKVLKIGADHETVTLNLLNGDTLTGVIGLKPIELKTVFGKASVGIEHVREFRIVPGGGVLPAGEGPLAFGGVNWTPWRTVFEVQGDKLVSLPKARPGFSYGHGGHGRGPKLMTNIGNPDWKDYSVECEFCVTGVDPALNPHGLPLDYRGGAALWFHVADAKESHNERGDSAYIFVAEGDGAWSLSCVYNFYCAAPTGFTNARDDGRRNLASGRGLKMDRVNGNKYRIDVRGHRIQIWVDGEPVVDVADEKMDETIGGTKLDHGGVGFTCGFDTMGWIRNFAAIGL